MWTRREWLYTILGVLAALGIVTLYAALMVSQIDFIGR